MRPDRLVRTLLLALALTAAAAPASLRAQDAAAPPAAAAAADSPATAGAPPLDAAPATQTLRRSAAAPPRTLRAYWHVFAAYAFAWVLLFGYALALGRRFARLEGEVRRLEGAGS
jgi:CcmD family protein